MEFLIKNAMLPDGNKGDILCIDGKIAAISDSICSDNAEIFNANGLYVSAGLIDMHVHLRDPGLTHKEDIASGGSAAVAGGITTVLCMPNTKPVCDSVEVLEYIIKKAETESPARILPIAAVTLGQKGEGLTNFEALSAAGAAAFSDDGMPVMSREIMTAAMERAAKLGKPVISHCEDLDFKEPRSAADYSIEGCEIMIENDEEAMAARDISIALKTGLSIHIAHVSTKNTIALVREGKARGAKVTCETCPHYLLLTSDAVSEKGTYAKMNPILRNAEDREAALQGLCDGTIDVLVTDHAPHSAEEKAVEFNRAPNGIVGLETLFAGALTALAGRMPLEKILEKMTVAPARLLGIDAGRLEVGATADLIIYDPNEKWVCDPENFKSKSKNSPFGGFEFTGRIKATIVGGKVVYMDEKQKGMI